MHPSAQNAYTQVRRETASPRKIEYELFVTLAAQIENADPTNPEGYRTLVHALQRNAALWTSLASDLMHPDNQCSDRIKADLLNLANYSITRGIGLLKGEGDRMILVEINRTVAAGLRPLANAA